MGVSIKEVRLLLEESGDKYTDQQVVDIIELLTFFANIEIEMRYGNTVNHPPAYQEPRDSAGSIKE